MSCCSHCADAGKMFDDKTARKDLKRYKRKGPDKSTRLILENLGDEEVRGGTLLDIGGGIGAISFELFQRGLGESVHVDASRGYLTVSQDEAENRDLVNRITYHYGDYVDLSEQLAEADIVTLDRVVCCYPDLHRLIDASAGKARQLIGLVYPRNRWYVRLGMRLGNLWFRIRNIDFRTYLHPPGLIHRQMIKNGFRRRSHEKTFIWEAAVYQVNGHNTTITN